MKKIIKLIIMLISIMIFLSCSKNNDNFVKYSFDTKYTLDGRNIDMSIEIRNDIYNTIFVNRSYTEFVLIGINNGGSEVVLRDGVFDYGKWIHLLYVDEKGNEYWGSLVEDSDKNGYVWVNGINIFTPVNEYNPDNIESIILELNVKQ